MLTYHESTRAIMQIRQLLTAAGYEAEDVVERLFDALIDLHHRQGADAVRIHAKTLGLPFADKPYKSNTTP